MRKRFQGSHRYLIAPLNTGDNHWVTLTASANPYPTIYDFLGEDGSPQTIARATDLLNGLRTLLPHMQWHTGQWVITMGECARQQQRSNDCGLHVIWNVLSVLGDYGPSFSFPIRGAFGNVLKDKRCVRTVQMHSSGIL